MNATQQIPKKSETVYAKTDPIRAPYNEPLTWQIYVQFRSDDNDRATEWKIEMKSCTPEGQFQWRRDCTMWFHLT